MMKDWTKEQLACYATNLQISFYQTLIYYNPDMPKEERKKYEELIEEFKLKLKAQLKDVK